MHTLALTAIGSDRPGIVAGVTRVLYGLGCNLADCSMTLLAGHFAMIMAVECPDEVTLAALDRELAGPAGQLGLTVSLREITGEQHRAAGPPYVVSVYGADRPGIVYRVTERLARRGVNVTNLQSRSGSGVYTVVLDVDVPPEAVDQVTTDLARLADELGVDLVLRPADTDAL